MKRAIISTNNNKLYLDCVPLTTTAWSKFGYIPTLIYVGEEPPVGLQAAPETEVLHVNVPNEHSAFVSQIVRVFAPTQFPEDVCVTGDIDMVPLQAAYFDNLVEQAANAAFVVASADAYQQEQRYPICYFAGLGSVYSSILGFDPTSQTWLSDKFTEWQSAGFGWDTDEKLFTKRVIDWEREGNVVKKLSRGWINNHVGRVAERRLDRVCWSCDEQLLKDGYYIDAHLPRPYPAHPQKIQPLIDYIAHQP